MFASIVLAALLALSAAGSSCAYDSSPVDDKKPAYQVWSIPEKFNDVSPSTTTGAFLMGGGTDVDEGFEWQISNANGGDFVVLRASGDDAYNPYVYNLSQYINKPLNSMTTILFNDRSASNDPKVLQLVSNAEAIFFAGGDQSDYLKLWTGTKLQSVIQSKASKITIGGTSAGLAILGNWVYSALFNSATSEECLKNPYNHDVTLTSAPFLKLAHLSNIITDTHFNTRDRMGRMLTFMARLMTDQKVTQVFGLGVSEATAVLLGADGLGRMVGSAEAYLCSSDGKPPAVCQKNKHLTYEDITCTRYSAPAGDVINFVTDTAAKGGVTYENNISDGAYTPANASPYGPAPSSAV